MTRLRMIELALRGGRGDASGPGHRGRGAVPGKAAQVDPIKPVLKAPGYFLLKLRCGGPLSNIAFNFTLSRYMPEAWASANSNRLGFVDAPVLEHMMKATDGFAARDEYVMPAPVHVKPKPKPKPVAKPKPKPKPAAKPARVVGLHTCSPRHRHAL